MAKIISFCNQKGGVGKTTSAVNIAASLGILGYKVLLIDLDPQGNATSGAGIAKKSLELTVNDVLTADVPMADAIIETEYDNLDLVPTNIALAGAEFALRTNGEKQRTTGIAGSLSGEESHNPCRERGAFVCQYRLNLRYSCGA